MTFLESLRKSATPGATAPALEPGPTPVAAVPAAIVPELGPLRRAPVPLQLAGLREPKPVQRVAPQETERDALVQRLQRAGFVRVPANSPVQRWRLADGRALGFPGGVNVFVPERFSRDAPLHLHLHGFILAGGGNIEQQVFRRTDKHDLWRMVQNSGTRGVVVMPESPGNNTLFNAQWGGEAGAQRFDTFTSRLARLVAERDQFQAASLSTHSGSGLLGDRLVLGSRFGREIVRYRGHFDDGYGTRDWRTRYDADRALVERGGYVLSLARAPSTRDHIGEGSNHMNAAAYYERTGRNPTFVTTPYRVRVNGDVVTRSDTFVHPDQLLPTIPMSSLNRTPTEQVTRFNVTTRNHWEPKNAFEVFWGFGASD